MFSISHHSFNFNNRELKVALERYSNLKKIDIDRQKTLSQGISVLLINCWGEFPEKFIEEHIFGSNTMIVARIDNECIGLCVLSIKNIFGKEVHYIEFLLINKKYQKCGLGTFLSFMTIRQEILRKSLSILRGKPLEIFFITPNIRVLSSVAKIASFTYPDPYLSDQEGNIGLADDETWAMASEILKNSDAPNRELNRNGLVLSGSYVALPWLIYNNDNAPWHSNDVVNRFARKYLKYGTNEDKEFIVFLFHSNFSHPLAIKGGFFL